MKKHFFESIILLSMFFFIIVLASCGFGAESKEKNVVNGKTIAVCFAGVLTDIDFDNNTADVKLYPKEVFEGCKRFAHIRNTQEETITLKLKEEQLREAYIGADIEFSCLKDDLSEKPLPVLEWTIFQIPIQEIVERETSK